MYLATQGSRIPVSVPDKDLVTSPPQSNKELHKCVCWLHMRGVRWLVSIATPPISLDGWTLLQLPQMPRNLFRSRYCRVLQVGAVETGSRCRSRHVVEASVGCSRYLRTWWKLPDFARQNKLDLRTLCRTSAGSAGWIQSLGRSWAHVSRRLRSETPAQLSVMAHRAWCGSSTQR